MIDINKSLGVNYNTPPAPSKPSTAPNYGNLFGGAFKGVGNFFKTSFSGKPVAQAPSTPSTGYDFSNYNPAQTFKDLVANKGALPMTSQTTPTPPKSNPVQYPFQGVTSDYAFTSGQDFLSKGGDWSQVHTLPPGTPVGDKIPYYKYGNSDTVYKNSKYNPTPAAPSAPGSTTLPPSPDNAAGFPIQNEGMVNADSSPYSPVSASNVSPQVDTNALQGNPTTNSDIYSMLQNNINNQNSILNTIGQLSVDSPDVLAARGQYNDLNSQIAQTNTDYEDQIARLGVQPGVTTGVATAQQAEASRQTGYKLSTLSNQANLALNTINTLTNTRQQRLDAAKYLFSNINKPLTDTIAIYSQLAPQNLSTQYNPTTGDLFSVTRNPLTGQVTTQKTANIGAQKSYTSTNIETDPNTGQLMFIGVTGSGQVESFPISGGGTSGVGTSQTGQPGSYGSFGQTANSAGQLFRTDRNNNPIAAAVTMNGSNQFTKALDAAGVKWTYGDGFGDNMATIKIQGDPVEGSRAILANTNALQGWYASHTGKDVMSQYGIKNNVDFAKATPQIQNAVIQGIYKAENGGKAASLFNTQAAPSLPSVLTGGGVLKSTSDGINYFDKDLMTPAQITMAKNLAPSIPILDNGNVNKIQQIDVTSQNLTQLSQLTNKILSGGIGGRVWDSIINPIKGKLQTDPEIASFNSYRDTAINTIQALAGGEGSGLRLNQAEIDTATSNIPKITDNKETAQQKISLINSFLAKWKSQLLPNSVASNNNPAVNNYLSQLGL